ncbi:predicted protein [Chaetoceros tenuissimus]|uniref:Uncharacterized protein n=1 Tax=Chaetoceros tenuissimus TaxID=426638 RepID=A0AAD3DEE9_9STRA|nr:predicted protein [Chaetoceros tenuissimus]
MDDTPTFTAFVQNVLGVAVARAHTELVAYIPTFRRLMTISASDIDEFIKQVHSSNSGRAAAQRLAALDQAQLNLMKNYCDQALQDKANDESITLPEITVPKFTSDNYDDFMAKFLTVVSRTKSVHGVSIDYIVREADGNFNDIHQTRKLKLRACLSRRGPKFQEDQQTLFGLYLQYIGTSGNGANIVKQFQPRKQGYNLHFAFTNHFANDTYLQNKASQAATDLAKLNYSGDKLRFKLEDYYNRMTQCFNDSANGGAQYALNDHQKIQSFCQGLKNDTAIKYHVDAKQAWDNIQGPKDFDTYYNLFSSKLQQYCTLRGDGSHTDNRRINHVDTGGRGRGRGG